MVLDRFLKSGRASGSQTPSVVSSDDTREYDIINTPASTVNGDHESLPEPNVVEKTEDVRLELHPMPQKDGILISVHPPKAPSKSFDHAPCDIVLVIDVSGSMNDNAPVPVANPSEKENNGLTVLDLTKHAARTILETLDGNDRLAVVTFSNEAKVVQKLTPMTAANKKTAWNRIDGLRPEAATNLWHGILEGIKVFEGGTRAGSVPSIMVLTDGMPNHMCPPQGYVPKLRAYDIPAAIHTFGFGYHIRSNLLRSIAEVGGGNYSFIPDAGMIGTVFVHAVANMQSTFATSANLTISASEGLTLAETLGDYVRREQTDEDQPKTQLTIPLGNIQYGQSRDVPLRYGSFEHGEQTSPLINATLHCTPLDNSTGTLSTSRSIDNTTDLPPALLHYHRTRARICFLISGPDALYDEKNPQEACKTELSTKNDELQSLIAELRDSAQPHDDELNQSLLADLCGTEPAGQIQLALSKGDFFRRWGRHYLPSLLHAHARQQCNSFKDPGPLQYGKDSPLFVRCRQRLDHAFDSLPAPKPSKVIKDSHGKTMAARPVSMARYHRSSNPCFAAECKVKLWNGEMAEVGTLRPGSVVWTPRGQARIVAVMATKVVSAEMCTIGGLVITPWHPVCVNGRWVFPAEVAESTIKYTGSVYSLLLEPLLDVDAHGIEVGGQLAVTLGHGITRAGEGNDARVHAFFGDYAKIVRSLGCLPATEDGVLVSKGVERDGKTGLVRGFLGGGSDKVTPSGMVLGEREGHQGVVYAAA